MYSFNGTYLRWLIGFGLVCLGLTGARCDVAQTDPPAVSYGDTVFRPGAVWYDDKGAPIDAHGGGFLNYGGTIYWYGEHKVTGRAGNFAQVGVHVYSSMNLHDWKDEGIALAVSEDPESDITKGCVIERPKVAYNARTGKFVMWFHLELKGHGYSSARAGVAIADRPAGPYQYLGSCRLNAGVWPENFPLDEREPLTADEAAGFKQLEGARKKDPAIPDLAVRHDFAGGQMVRDMTLYVDDDGKAYVVYASEENSTIEIAQLTNDYLRADGDYIRILINGYNEAPTMFKHDGKYFLITSGQRGWSPCDARLSTADSILGTWTLVGNPCRGSAVQRNTTFGSQGAYILPVPGNKDGYIFMADRWRPQNPIDGRYVWLPIHWENGLPALVWQDSWTLDEIDP